MTPGRDGDLDRGAGLSEQPARGPRVDLARCGSHRSALRGRPARRPTGPGAWPATAAAPRTGSGSAISSTTSSASAGYSALLVMPEPSSAPPMSGAPAGLLDGTTPVYVVVDDGMPMHAWKECRVTHNEVQGSGFCPKPG